MAASPRGYLSPYSLPFGSVQWIALSASAAALAASLQAQQFALAAAQIAEVAETASFLCELGDLAHSSDSQSESSSPSPLGSVVLSPREELPVWVIPESPPVPSNSPVTVPDVTVTGRAVPRGSARNPVAFTYCFREPGGRFESYSSK